MFVNSQNLWKVMTIALGLVFLLSIIVYLTLVYALPALGASIDLPVITRLGSGAIIGILVMFVSIVVPILFFIAIAALFGFGFGLGFSSTPVGRSIIANRR